MASPFSVFRRNQRAMIAVLGILCMFAFVFLPILFQSLDSAGSAGNPVVVRTRYGDLRETELFQLRRRTAQLNQYLERLVAQVVFNLRNDPQGFFREVGEQQLFSLLASQLQQQGFLIDPSEQFVVENFILARTAEELGLRVSNATINEFLGQVSQDMTGDQLRQVLSQVEITEGTLFEALRDQLLSMRLQQSLFRGMQG